MALFERLRSRPLWMKFEQFASDIGSLGRSLSVPRPVYQRKPVPALMAI